MKKGKMQVFASKINKVNNQKIKDEIILSIQKNVICLDLLEELKRKYEDNFKYTGKREDEILIEQIAWIKFQIEYNQTMFDKSLKKLGGSISDVKPFEWK